MTGNLLAKVGEYALCEAVALEITVWRGDEFVGTVFPAIVAAPEGRWYARRRGLAAEPHDGRDQALAWLLDVPVEDVRNALEAAR